MPNSLLVSRFFLLKFSGQKHFDVKIFGSGFSSLREVMVLQKVLFRGNGLKWWF